jgi:hypothetical protein
LLGVVILCIISCILCVQYNLSEGQGKLLFGLWFFVVLGLGIFIGGFHTFRRFRLLADRAESPIRGLAMGFVEISGRARPAGLPPTPSPVSATPCLRYELEVEGRVPDAKRHTTWDNFIDRRGQYFYLED